MFTLYVEDDQGRKTEVPFAPPGLSIGRDKENNVRLNERNVSRKHAKLSAGNGGIFIEDLDSYNGVKINGDRIQGKAPIFLGDRIQLGDFLLQVQGDTLKPRPEEITQKTQAPKAVPMGHGDEVTNTEPMVVAPINPGLPQPPQLQPPQRPSNGGGDRGNFDEATALIRLNDINPKQPTSSAQTVVGPNPKLVCVKGPMAGQEWAMNKSEIVIGRGAENDIQIDHRSMSRAHAKLVIAGQTCRIVDMGSANGTLVNGEQYAQVDLKRGDVIELGHVKLRVVWPGEAAPKIDAPSDSSFDESTAISARANASQGRRTQELDASKSNKPLFIAVVAGVAVAITGIVVWVAITPEQQQVAPQPTPTPTPAPTPVVNPTPTPPPVAAPAIDVNEVLRRANTEMASENWDQAIRILENGLEHVPGNPQLKNALEKSELERGAKTTFDAAMAAYQKVDMATARELFMQIAEQSSYYQRAIKKLSEPKVRNAQAPKTAQKGSTPKASKTERTPPPEPDRTEKPEPKPAPPPEAAASESPRDKAKKLFEQGNQALKGNNVRGAIDLFSESVKADPKFAPPHRSLGIAHARAGNGDAAVQHYRLYLQLNPGASDAEAIKRIIQEYETPGD